MSALRFFAGLVFALGLGLSGMTQPAKIRAFLDVTGAWDPRVPPTSWMHRLEITSLTFMFDCVPEPVCQTNSGNSESSSPRTTSSQTRPISWPFQAGSRPAAVLTTAAAFLTYP